MENTETWAPPTVIIKAQETQIQKTGTLKIKVDIVEDAEVTLLSKM